MDTGERASINVRQDGHDSPGKAPDARPLPPNAQTVCLLDADGDLADRFDARSQLLAREAATVAVVRAATGSLDQTLLASARDGFGLLLLDGLIAYETTVGSRTAVELLGAGDLLDCEPDRDDTIVARRDSWRILWPCRLAALDAGFVDRVRPWPQIAQVLVRRTGRRASELEAIRAISGHPRLELRLDLAFWHLAGRWGRVEPAGIHLALPLTHRLLGELVGAERPSISHALARLSQARLVTGNAGDWHLVGSLRDHMDALLSSQVRVSTRNATPSPRPRTA